jgi:hypothetical protein
MSCKLRVGMKNVLIFLIFLFVLPNSYALIELNGDYGVSTQKYGENRDNEIEATTIGGSVALYLFNLTAIELNYSQTETITSETNVLTIDSTYDLVGQENNVLVYSYGIGIRQAFASRKARFRPSMSLGYARQFIRDTTQASFRNNVTGNTFIVNDDVTKLRDDSVFGSFSLEMRLTQTVSLRGSVKTIFKAFQFDKAKDNVRYLLGFSWYL